SFGDVGSGTAWPRRLLGQRHDLGFLPGGVVEPAIQPDDGVGAVHGNRLGGGRAESGAESQAMRQRENPDDAAPDQSRGEDKTSRARDAMRHLPDGADG